MATEVPIPESIETLIANLETHRNLITNLSTITKTLTEHFNSVEKTLSARAKSLDLSLETLETETQQTLQSLDERETSIPTSEAAATVDIQSRRDAVVAEIESQTAPTCTDIRTDLSWICRRMDASTLWRYCSENKREMTAIRQEITGAVEEAVDPARLVVDSLEDFVSSEVERETDQCWIFTMFLRLLYEKEVAVGVRERAAEVALKWRTRFGERMEREIEGDGEGEPGRPEGQLFLTIVGVFQAQERFEKEYLEKIFLIHGKKREIAKFVHVLDVADKVGEVVAKMANAGKEIEAIYVAHEAGMLGQISPADLLKSYLQKAKEKANAFLKAGKGSPASVESANNLENNCFKAVIKCVETCKLESKFNIMNIKRKVAINEREREERKKFAALNPYGKGFVQPNGPPKGKRAGPAVYPPPSYPNGSGAWRFGDYGSYRGSGSSYGPQSSYYGYDYGRGSYPPY
ncbi:Protein FRIGIDA [Rhynchospora pubera]|uniref:FRIGIDA-like protein n=1 Tax=Rhynchospora pubera TaxID=906938 RepID=A0AAV8FMS9_9POAL|nr:Protein FRIGIDA [Rhynchospora pubera]